MTNVTTARVMSPATRAKPPATEHAIQAAFVTWTCYAQARLPELRLAFAVPNGGSRGKITASLLKAEGVRRGVPDWWLPVPRKGFTGLAIEFKRPKTGRISDDQKTYLYLLRSEGWFVEVCTDWEDARAHVQRYLERPGGNGEGPISL